MTSVCVICVEKINKTVHAKICCQYCSYEACRSCCETYILGQSIPKCMDSKCGKEWTRKFMVQAFSKSFMSGAWKKNVEKKLLDKEIALLPATQGIVENLIQKEKMMEEAKQLDKLIREMETRRRNIIYEATSGIVVVTKATGFVRGCPADECRGYLSPEWKCGLCEKWTCPDCHVVKGIDKDFAHVCNPDELATAKLLEKDTKACPKCSAGIFKIAGCDQMWCTQCHTAFSWKTGFIETHIHNPHFYEWQRRNGGAPRLAGDILCGQEITHNSLNNFRAILKGNLVFDKWSSKSALQIYDQLSSIIQNLIHLRRVQIPQFRVDNVVNNQDLRVKYLRKEIDLDTFKSRIHRENKKFEKKREIYEILTMFAQTVTDILIRTHDYLQANHAVFAEYKEAPRMVLLHPKEDGKEEHKRKRSNVEEKTRTLLREIETIREYSNECLYETSQTFGSKPKCISNISEKFIGDVLIDLKVA